MTPETEQQFLAVLTSIADRLAEIREAMKAPSPMAAQAPHTPTGPPSQSPRSTIDADWARFTWPKFCDSKGHLQAEGLRTLGDSANGGEKARKSLLWWAENYVPRPYKGEISANDTAFRAALDGAKAHLSGGAQHAPGRRPAATEDQMANIRPDTGDDSVPF